MNAKVNCHMGKLCDVMLQPETCPMTSWTVVHFFIGTLAQQLGFPAWLWFFLNVIFEIVENRTIIFQKASIWSQNYGAWPEYKGDSLENSSLDVIWGMLGWLFGWFLDFIILRRNNTKFWNY